MTNFEKLKEMSLEEIVFKIIEIGCECECCFYDNYLCNGDCAFGVKKWLEMSEE